MSKKKLFLHFLNEDQIAAVKAAGHNLEQFALSEVDKAVAALKTTDIGKAVSADIEAVASKSLSGAEKFEAVLANTLPLIVSYVTGGGVSAVINDVEDIGRSLVQSVFNDVKSSSAGKIAGEVLHLVGIS